MKKTVLCLLLVLSMLISMVPAFADANTDLQGKVRFVTAYKESQGMGDLIAEFNQIYPRMTATSKLIPCLWRTRLMSLQALPLREL